MLWVNQLEDRTTPTVTVNATAIQNAIESGTDGIITVSRDGDTTDPLDVELSIGGTPTEDTDYTTAGTSITIPAGESSADFHVVPIWNKVNDTGSRTVSVDVIGGMDYDAGTSATISIQDDVDPSPILVHQSTFQLTGSSGSVNVSLTVTYTAPTEPMLGTYTWQYQVQNPSSPTGTTTWTTFSIPISTDPDTSDVGNLTGPSGWTGTVGSDNVSWVAGSGGLAPGGTATFSFTTAPREHSTDTVEMTDGGTASASAAADKPGSMSSAPARGDLAFFNGRNQGTLKLSIITASGQTYTTDSINIDQNGPKEARDQVWNYLDAAGWKVVKLGDTGIEILGFKSDGSVDGVESVTRTMTGFGGTPSNGFAYPPKLTGTGQILILEN